jgi:hypothetical protein
MFPKTNMFLRALMCPFVYFHPTSHPAGGVKVLQEAWDLLSDGVKAIFRTAESNLDALNTSALLAFVNARCKRG